jgi:hypothetical protein
MKFELIINLKAGTQIGLTIQRTFWRGRMKWFSNFDF